MAGPATNWLPASGTGSGGRIRGGLGFSLGDRDGVGDSGAKAGAEAVESELPSLCFSKRHDRGVAVGGEC